MFLVEPVKLRIRDNEYLIQCDEDQDTAQRIAEYVNKRLMELEREADEGLSEKKAALLAALSIASDYFLLLKRQEEILGKIKQRTEALIKSIDAATG
jgi:cell division protein ZapA (FtsZ GTPase activity inhibitor)